MSPIRPVAEVVELYNHRVRTDGAEKQVMREIAALHDGELVVSLPEVQKAEQPAIANIAWQGINQTRQRITSVFPEIEALPVTASDRELEKARSRRRAFYNFHEQSKSPRKLRRLAGYLVGYASGGVRLRPNMATSMPMLDVRSPLGMYACPSGDPDVLTPSDCIFATRQTLGWLSKTHPDARARLGVKKSDKSDTPIDVLEYTDSNVIYLIAARRDDGGETFDFNEVARSGEVHLASDFALIAAVPNRAGRPLVHVPGQISISMQKSPYHQIIGMYLRAAELDALAFTATRQGVMPETWMVANPGEEPELVQAPNQFSGVPGVVKGASLQHRNTPPQFVERVAVGDLERAQRLTVGVNSDMTGEAGTNVRTGRRSDQLMSAVLDFPVQEWHEILEETLGCVNEGLAAIDLAYFPDEKRSFSVSFAKERGHLEYEPGKLWKGPKGEEAFGNRVSYFAAGLDAENRIVAIGQRMGMGTMSAETGMRHDPLVDDVEGEIARVKAEKVERTIEARIDTLAADPNSPLSIADLASFEKKVESGKSYADAWIEVEKEIAERVEAEQASQQASLPSPVGAGVEAPQGAAPAIGGPPESAQNLNSLLLSLRGPGMTTPAG